MMLTITVREKQIGIFSISLSGKLDSSTHMQLQKRIDLLMESSPKAIIFDLTDLVYISSAGLRVIFKTRKEMKTGGGSCAFINLQPQIQKVMDIIGALPSLKIFGSVEELDAYLDAMQAKKN